MKDSTTAEWPSDVRGCLEHWIEQRTSGRIYGLRVDTPGDRVIVHGHTGSYHVRQLALAAVLEVLEELAPGAAADVELDVQVVRCAPAYPNTVPAKTDE